MTVFDVTAKLTPEQAQRMALAKQATWFLMIQAREYRHFENYYKGSHRLAYATSKYREAFGRLLAASALNFCEMAVNVVSARIEVAGFSADDAAVADAAWRAHQDLGLDGSLSVAYRQALVYGEAYLVSDPKAQTVTVEDTRQMFVQKNPANPTQIKYAFKGWLDTTTGFSWGILMEADTITTFRSREPSRIDPLTGLPSLLSPTLRAAGIDWQIVDEQPNPLARVPVFVLSHSPDANHRGRSALQSLIPIQDGINKLANDLIVASEFQAFRQRVLTGVEIPKNPETGKPLPTIELEASMSRLWSFEPTDAKVTELSETSLANYSDAIRTLIGSFSTIAVLPPTYMVAATGNHLSNVSGEAVAALELAHVARCEELQRQWRGPITEAMRLALGIDGSLNVEWRPVQRPSLSTLGDYVVKAASIGVPKEELFRALGYSPTQIAKMLAVATSPPETERITETGQGAPVQGGAA
jgi:hypothetical protein